MRRTLCALTAWTALVMIADQVVSADYSFRIVAEVGDVIEGRRIVAFSHEDNPIVINDSRDIAFLAALDQPGNYAIIKNDSVLAGAGKVVDGLVPRFVQEDHAFAMNTSGQVVYRGILDNSTGTDFDGGAIFLDDRVVANIGDVLEGRTIRGVDFRPSVNDRGTVVFAAVFDDFRGNTREGIFTQAGIVEFSSGGPAQTGEVIDGVTLGPLYDPEINNADEIAFSAILFRQNTGPDVPFHTGILTQDGLIIESSQTDVYGNMVVSHTEVDSRVLHGDISVAGIDDSGNIAFSSLWNPWTGVEQGWFTQDELMVKRGDVIDGREIQRFTGGEFSKSGHLAFLANTPAGRSAFYDGAFVVGEGDVVEGRTIEAISEWLAVNRGGDLSFLAHFTDGSSGIVFATVPEPAGLTAIAVASMAMSFRFRRRLRIPSRSRHRQ